MLSGDEGELVQGYLYTPFGEMWAKEDGEIIDADGDGIDDRVDRLFTGQRYDKESGLYYMNARYYDPDIGTFMTADPAMSGLNHYAYANANPIRYTDPTGVDDENGGTWESGTDSGSEPSQGSCNADDFMGDFPDEPADEINWDDVLGPDKDEQDYIDMVAATSRATLATPAREAAGAGKQNGHIHYNQVNNYWFHVGANMNQRSSKQEFLEQQCRNKPGIVPEGKFTLSGRFNDDYRGIGIYAHHEGIDIGTKMGTPLQVNLDYLNVILINDVDRIGYGRFLVAQDLYHTNIFYLAAHCSKILVSEGVFPKGTVLAFSGNSGGKNMSTHYHGGTYSVPSGLLWTATKEEGGLFYSKNYYINQSYCVDPYNWDTGWKGAKW